MVSPGAVGPLRLVCFELRGQELALPIADVRETLPVPPITRVFLVPPCLAGVFSLRGDIVPVIDLGVLLGLPATQIGHDSRIVVIDGRATPTGSAAEGRRGSIDDRAAPTGSAAEGRRGSIDGRAGVAGVVVDRLRDLRTVDGALDPPPASLAVDVASLLAGVVATPTGSVRVLDARAVLTAEPLRALARSDAESRVS